VSDSQRQKRSTMRRGSRPAPAPAVDYWSRTYPTRQALFKDKPSETRPATLSALTPESTAQFVEAREVAMKLLDSGVVGDSECVVTISGHANPGHEPTNGRANDRLSISIQSVAH
jgi:hypothetical protein